MKGTVIKAFEKTSNATGKKYWNVMVQVGEGISSYLTSAESLTKEGSEIEFNADAPKKPGDTPWIRTIGQQQYQGKGGGKSGGNVKAFACSYAKDLAVSMIRTMSSEQIALIDKKAVIADLDMYYSWFMKKMEE